MLTRAARRKTRHNALRRFSSPTDSLILPWLCPALMRWHSSTITVPSSIEARRYKPLRPVPTRTETRHLATQTDGPFDLQASKDPIPFVGILNGPHRGDGNPVLPSPNLWDGLNPLVIHNGSSARFRVINHKGVGGDSEEIMQNLHASLRVGRFDRAANLVRRMRAAGNPTNPDLLLACNEYLTELVNRLRLGKDVTYESVQQWFEVDIRAQGIIPNASTFILMVKACMMGLTGSKQERTLRRYLALAREVGNDVWAQVISAGEFSGMEWDYLIRLQPRELHPLPYQPEDSVIEEEKEPAVNEYWPTDDEISARIPQESNVLPNPRSVPQKGIGLDTLKRTLIGLGSEHDVPYSPETQGTEEEQYHAWLAKRQLKLEENVYTAARERWRQESLAMAKQGIHTVMTSRSVETLMWNWHSALVPVLKKEIKEIRKVLDNWNSDVQSGDGRAEFGPYLEQFTPEKLASIVSLSLITKFVSDGLLDGVKMTMAAFSIGNHLEREAAEIMKRTIARQRRRLKVSAQRMKIVNELYRGSGQLNEPGLESQRKLENAKLLVQSYTKLEWPKVHKVRVGALLLQKVIDTAKIEVTTTDPATGKRVNIIQPAFAHTYMYTAGRKVGMIRMHRAISEMLTKEPVESVIGARLPMITVPRPWTGIMEGGYLRSSVNVIRQQERDDIQRMYAFTAAEKDDLDQVFAGLDVLGKTPWKINRDVLSVLIDVWNSGKAVAKIPPEDPKFTFPEKPPPESTAAVFGQWMNEMRQVENKKNGMHSDRCFQNFQLEVARAFAYETFYFPHNLDFRGRAYPIPPYLNQMGADMPRGLLLFAKGKELGEVGLTWLKIHLANVYGYDKASLKERQNFAAEHFDDIVDSVERPLDGKRWWLEAEDPWQCLATCIELKRALESEDPKKFVSYLPVHQDGTCNGLQHYAALGGDAEGASQVNLEPGDRPSDIYTAVAEIVKAQIKREAEDGHRLSMVLDGKITRKVVKQPVMTNVYGVTYYGACAQVEKQLRELMPNYNEREGPRMVYLSRHITRLIFRALSTIFSGAIDIQKWLGDCTRRITRSITPEQIERAREFLTQGTASENQSRLLRPNYAPKKGERQSLANILQFKNTVVWTTPLKLPVAQPYRVNKTTEVYTAMQQVRIKNPRSYDPVHSRRQVQAFAPNFIHSLDATHMLLSALKCDELGLTFASVHDSFWTHASDVPDLNRILRDAFIRMHSEDIMGRLAEEFKVRYQGCLYLKSIPITSPAYQAVRKFRAKKGWKGLAGNLEEMFLEYDRQNLLKSENPQDRKQGEEMVTSASIVESMMDLGATPGHQELELPIVGEVPAAESNEDDRLLQLKKPKGRPKKTPAETQELDLARTGEVPVVENNEENNRSRSKRPRGRPLKTALSEIPEMLTQEPSPPSKKIASSETTSQEVAMASEIDETVAKDMSDYSDVIIDIPPFTREAETIDDQITDVVAADKHKDAPPPPRVKQKSVTTLDVWLPLTFARVPAKGTFDVSRLRDSQYFFS